MNQKKEIMRNIFQLLTIVSILVLVSCKNNEEKPKLSYKIDKKVVEQKQDTAKIDVAGLPIQFETTNYLIYPIANINFNNNSSKSFEWKYEGNESFNVANNMDNEITGFMQNLKFQKTDSDSLVSLTDKPILIHSVNFLSTIAQKSKQQILVYLTEDTDTNKDQKLDNSDIKSLYLSDISGKRFTKISTDVQEVLDWKIIESKNRLYFRAIEDTNKNGMFDKNDKIHYNYVNLLEAKWKAIEFMEL